MKKLWMGVIVIIVILAGFLLLKRRRVNNSQQPKYEVVKVERGNIEVKVLSTGTIQPYTRVEVQPPISGRIERVEVEEGDRVRVGDILVWISSEDRITLLDAARSRLEQAKKDKDTSAIKEAELSYQIAERSYMPISLTTSISGEVIERSCEPGQNVSTQNILFVISDKLVAGVEADEVDIGKIKHGQEAKIVLDAFSENEVTGKVTKISREGGIVSDVVVFEVMVEPQKEPSYWASGMTANVEFLVERRQDALMIPCSAVKERKSGTSGKGRKFVMLSDDKPTPQEIETGISDGRMIEVTSGLKEGEEIILMSEQELSKQRNATGPPMRMMRRR